MRKTRDAGKILWKIVQAGIILLTLLGFIKAIFVSLDIDESYAVAQSYRLACGDKLFADMWESHQLSAFLGAVFIKPYLMLFGTADYLVIYLRIIGILIHAGLGAWLYRIIKPEFGEKVSFLMLFLHLNFLPKWVQVPEFEVMHYWFLLAAFLLLYSYFLQEKGSSWRPAAAGACLVGSMMSYPTMILLYPVYLAGLCVMERMKHTAKGKQMLRSSLWFTIGAGATGVGFLAYLFSYQTLEELVRNISYIFLDESHTTNSGAEKWQDYGEQFGEIALRYLNYVLVIVAVMAVIFLLTMLISGMKKKSPKQFFTKKNLEFAGLAVLILVPVCLQVSQIWGCLFQDENQFHLLVRFFAAILPGLYLGIRHHRKYALFLYLCILPAFASLPAVLIITNMDVNVACAKMFPGVLGSLLILFAHLKEKSGECEPEQVGSIVLKLEKVLTYVLSLGLLAGFFVCRLILIRVSGCLPITVKAPLEKMNAGPEKGIYVLQEQAEIWNENYAVIEEVVDADDKMLYIGAENLIYPAAGCVISSPSTQGTTIFNDMFLYYYEEHPERLPNLVVIDKTFGTNPAYGYFSDSGMILGWIEENFNTTVVRETEYLKILSLED